MNGSSRKYHRSDFPWADFSRIREVDFDTVFHALSLDEWLIKESDIWKGRCPFHNDANDVLIEADNSTGWYTCTSAKYRHTGSVAEFAKKILPHNCEVQVDFWLLQFAESERTKTLSRFEGNLARMTKEGRERVEKTYDSSGFFDRRAHQKILEEIVAGDHNRLLQAFVDVVTSSLDLPEAEYGDDLRDTLIHRISSLVERRSRRS